MTVVNALARKIRKTQFWRERQHDVAPLDPDFLRCRCRRRCRIVRSLLLLMVTVDMEVSLKGH